MMGIGGGWRASQEEMLWRMVGLRSRRVELMVRLEVRPLNRGERSRSTSSLLSFQLPVGVEVPGLDLRLDDAGEGEGWVVLVVALVVVVWTESDFVPLILNNHFRRSFRDSRQCKMANTKMVRTTAML